MSVKLWLGTIIAMLSGMVIGASLGWHFVSDRNIALVSGVVGFLVTGMLYDTFAQRRICMRIAWRRARKECRKIELRRPHLPTWILRGKAQAWHRFKDIRVRPSRGLYRALCITTCSTLCLGSLFTFFSVFYRYIDPFIANIASTEQHGFLVGFISLGILIYALYMLRLCLFGLSPSSFLLDSKKMQTAYRSIRRRYSVFAPLVVYGASVVYYTALSAGWTILIALLSLIGSIGIPILLCVVAVVAVLVILWVACLLGGVLWNCLVKCFCPVVFSVCFFLTVITSPSQWRACFPVSISGACAAVVLALTNQYLYGAAVGFGCLLLWQLAKKCYPWLVERREFFSTANGDRYLIEFN